MASSPAAKDVLEVLFLYLDVPTIATCASVCKLWCYVTTEDSLWHKVCVRDWPTIPDSALASCLQPPNLAKTLVQRLHRGYFHYVPLDVKDVELLLDISFGGQTIYSDALPYSLNLMVNCFNENLLLPPHERLEKFSPSLCHSTFLTPLRNHTEARFPTPPCEIDAGVFMQYIRKINISFVALRKTDFGVYRLIDRAPAKFGWERIAWELPVDNLGFEDTEACDMADWASRKKILDHAENSSLIPIFFRGIHWVSGSELLVADFYLFANLIRQKGAPGATHSVSLELVDYCFSVRGWQAGGVLVEGEDLSGGRYGLQQLSRARWLL